MNTTRRTLLNTFAPGVEADPALGSRARARQGGGRRVLVFGGHDRGLLPALLPIASRQSRRTSSCTPPWLRRKRQAFGRASAAAPTDHRCRSENAALVASACRLIERSGGGSLTRGSCQSAIGRSPSHFHRLFKADDRAHPARATPRPSGRSACVSGLERRRQRDRGDV